MAPPSSDPRLLGLRVIACAALAALVGCDVTATLAPAQEDAETLDGLVGLRIEPDEIELRIVDQTPARQRLTIVGVFDDGTERTLPVDRFPIQLRLLDPELGNVLEGELVTFSNRGGQTQVEASVNDLSALADVRIVYETRLELVDVDGELPDLDALFETAEAAGTDPERAPEVVYPITGVLLPPNLAGLALQFTRGDPDNLVFELSFTNEVTDIRFYVPCVRPAGIGRDGQCIIDVPPGPFAFLSETNRGGRPLSFQVRATDLEGTGLGVSNLVTIQFTEDEIEGTLYYWSVSERAIIRFDFGEPTAEPETVVAPSDAGGTCVGCHAISRDGTKVLASVGGQNDGGVMLRDLTVPRGEAGDFIWDAPDDNILQFASFSPTGDAFVGVFGDSDLYEDPDGAGNFGDLILFETDCADVPDGCQTGRIDLQGREASHPDWAQRSGGAEVIGFTDVGINNTSQRPRFGAVSFVRRAGPDAPWGPPETRIERADGLSRYNPSFSPEGGDIFVFNESTCPGGDEEDRDCNADSDPSAKVWVAETDGDAAPILLENAMRAGPTDDGGDLANTFPKFAPFVFVLESGELGDRRVLWLTFASIRRYGFRTPPGRSNDEAIRGTWLWMVAIEPERVAQGEDPSFSPFLLPFQDLGTSNHIAVWTERAVGDPILR